MSKLLKQFPFLPPAAALPIFRLALAAVFLGHAGMRLLSPHYFEHAGAFLATRGLPFGFSLLWLATAIELLGGFMLIFNKFSKWVALCFLVITAATMAFVQARHGWWVAEFGDGGMEFGFVVCAMCLFLISLERPAAKWLNPDQGYAILRYALAAFFMIHAICRFLEPHYFAGLGQGLGQLGMPFAYTLGLMATAIELIGGTLLVFNHFAKWAALGFFGISAVGIVYIHTHFGWFVGEFGNGGAELSVALCAICLTIAALDRAASAGAAPYRPLPN